MPDPAPLENNLSPGPLPPGPDTRPADGGAALYDAQPRPPVKSSGPSRQRPFECGPTTIADCARDQGLHDVTPDKVIKLARDDFMPGVGITSSATVKVLDKMGADAVIIRDPNISDLQSALRQGCKVIAWMEAPSGAAHIVRVQAITRDGKWVAIGETAAGQTFQQKSHNFYQQLNKAIVIKWRSEGGLGTVTLSGRPQWRGEVFLGEYGGDIQKGPSPQPRTQTAPDPQARLADRAQAALRHVGLDKQVRMVPGREGVTVKVLNPQGAVVEMVQYVPTSPSSTRKAAELLSRATLASPADVTFVLQTIGLLELLFHTVTTLREIADAASTLDLLEKYAEVLHAGARAAEAGDFTQVSGALADWSQATARLTGPVAGMGGGILWLQDRWLTTYGAEAIARMPRGYMMWLYTQYRAYIRRARTELAGKTVSAGRAPALPESPSLAPGPAPAEAAPDTDRPAALEPLTPQTLGEMGRLLGKIAEVDRYLAEMARRLAEGLRAGDEPEVTFTTNAIVRTVEARQAWAARLKQLTGIDAPPIHLPETPPAAPAYDGSPAGSEPFREVERGGRVAQEIRDRAGEWRALARRAAETASGSRHPVAREIWKETAKRHEAEARRLDSLAGDLAKAAAPVRPRRGGPARLGSAAIVRAGLLAGSALLVVAAGLGFVVGGLMLQGPARSAMARPQRVQADSSAPAPVAARPNLPPRITKFVAESVPADQATDYGVEASDPDGDSGGLRYEWSNTNGCGAFEWDAAELLRPDARWFHPHPPCPSETYHPAIIRVVVTDSQGGQTVFDYTGGSASSTLVLTPTP